MKKINFKNVKFLRRFSTISILLVSALLIETTSVIQYIYTRKGIETEVERRARLEIKTRSLKIQNEVSKVEAAINNMQFMLEWAVANPDHINDVLRQIMEANPAFSGCGIGFEPNYFKKHGQWYEPFFSRDNGEIVFRQIGDINHNYHEMEWYKEGAVAQGGRWTEPYLDEVGSQTRVCSYTIPLHNPSGRVVAVFACDVPLEWLDSLFTQQDDAFTFLASRRGRLIACPDKTLVMNTTIQEVAKQYNDSMFDVVNANILAGDSGQATIHDNDGKEVYMYYAPVEGRTGWSMSILFPDEVIYRDLNRVAKQLFYFMLIGLALMVFIMWRTVRGFRKLNDVTAEKERIGSELRIASGIQMGMLPKTFPPYTYLDELSMWGTLVPAKEVGGDLYDFDVRDDKVFFCIGDVSGKGVPASLVMAVTRSLFRTTSTHTDSPDRILTLINNAMSEMNENSLFVTLFVGVLDLQSGNLAYSNAGHCPPVIFNKDHIDILEMDANIPIGIMPEWSYTLQQTTICPGDIVFTYTDGLSEAENINHQLFGDERIVKQLDKDRDLTAKGIIDSMTAAVHAFVGEAEQSDDLTMLAIQFIKYFQRQP